MKIKQIYFSHNQYESCHRHHHRAWVVNRGRGRAISRALSRESVPVLGARAHNTTPHTAVLRAGRGSFARSHGETGPVTTTIPLFIIVICISVYRLFERSLLVRHGNACGCLPRTNSSRRIRTPSVYSVYTYCTVHAQCLLRLIILVVRQREPFFFTQLSLSGNGDFFFMTIYFYPFVFIN